MQGGSQQLSYFFSGGWDGKRMADMGNHQQRSTFSSSLSYSPIKNLNVDFSYGFIAENSLSNAVDFRSFSYLYP
ncbi:hypothetical protein [Sphingobacterium sp. MYb388]|uniref:hypothetical protein n=1 Tax=Sphingobacterium sp. MYb388 TaxID=2745437 RepID=UPI0030AA12FA